MTADRTDLVRVRFLQVPVGLMKRSMDHTREIMREFALIRLSDEDAQASVPGRLVEMTEQYRSQFAAISFRGFGEVSTAYERGEEHIDLEINLPTRVRSRVLELAALQREADEFCRRGDLITLATPPDLIALREWFFREIARQLEGGEPTPFREDTAG